MHGLLLPVKPGSYWCLRCDVKNKRLLENTVNESYTQEQPSSIGHLNHLQSMKKLKDNSIAN